MSKGDGQPLRKCCNLTVKIQKADLRKHIYSLVFKILLWPCVGRHPVMYMQIRHVCCMYIFICV